MKPVIFLSGLFIGQLIAYAVVELTPKPAVAAEQYCRQMPEVQEMLRVMDKMPLAITVTETGTPPDAIAALIGGMQ